MWIRTTSFGHEPYVYRAGFRLRPLALSFYTTDGFCPRYLPIDSGVPR